jgi:Cell wall-active antibiotics response LiaF, C-terminal
MSSLPPAPASSRPDSVHTGRLLLGLALVALGVLWLLQALDVATIDWNIGLPIAVVAVGIALLVAGFVGRGSGGLVGLGVVLTILLAVSTVVDVPLGGGIGARSYHPAITLNRTYELAIGKLTVDLTTLPAEGEDQTIRAHVGIGQLVVVVPRSAFAADVNAKVGVGDATVFGVSEGGFGVEYRNPRSSTVDKVVVLDLSVGIGQVEVRRG